MIQIKQFDGSLKDEPHGQQIAGTPFAVVPVSGDDGTEGWSLIHIPTAMAVGSRSPGWYFRRPGIAHTKYWWRRLDTSLTTAFEGTHIAAMKSAGATPALERLIEASDFVWTC